MNANTALIVAWSIAVACSVLFVAAMVALRSQGKQWKRQYDELDEHFYDVERRYVNVRDAYRTAFEALTKINQNCTDEAARKIAQDAIQQCIDGE